MTYVADAAVAWMASSGMPALALVVDVVPPRHGWTIIGGVLAAVCAALWIAANPNDVFKRRPKLRLVRPTKRPQPQHA